MGEGQCTILVPSGKVAGQVVARVNERCVERGLQVEGTGLAEYLDRTVGGGVGSYCCYRDVQGALGRSLAEEADDYVLQLCCLNVAGSVGNESLGFCPADKMRLRKRGGSGAPIE